MRRSVRAASKKALATFLRANRMIRLRIELDLRDAEAEHAATPQQMIVLLRLSEGSATVGELAEALGVSAPTMSSAVTTLEERGWAVRVADEVDRRRTHVRLTDDGRSVLTDMRGTAERGLGGVLEHLDDDEIERLEDGLAVLMDALDRTEGAPVEAGPEDDGRTRVTSG